MKLALVLLAAACGQTYQKPADQAPQATRAEAGNNAFSEVPSDVEGQREAPAAPPKSTPSAPTTASASAAPKPSSAAQRWVDAHNKVRSKHCAAPLTWSGKLAEVAQKWADTLESKGCMFGHSPGSKYGENLSAGTSGALDPESSTMMWYDEVAKYKFPSGGFSMETGHFTQVVWTTTKQVGCGQVTCKGMDIFVCNYDPPGNVQGEYPTHVLSTSCKK